MRIYFFPALFVLCSGTLSTADGEDYHEQYSACIDDIGYIDNDVVAQCAGTVTELAQRAAYDKIDAIISSIDNLGASPEPLMHAQEAWEKYVSYECDFLSQHIGSPMAYYCPMAKWIERHKELDSILNK